MLMHAHKNRQLSSGDRPEVAVHHSNAQSPKHAVWPAAEHGDAQALLRVLLNTHKITTRGTKECPTSITCSIKMWPSAAAATA
jgi:hypothetical protein